MSFLSGKTNLHSFKICECKSASNGNINNSSKPQTPENYLLNLNAKWQTEETVSKGKMGRSSINLRTKDHLPVEDYPYSSPIGKGEEAKNDKKNKFGKKYIKRKFAKIFRSSGKLNETNIQNKMSSAKDYSSTQKDCLESQCTQSNDTLRNLSFTAAMMSKDSNLNEKAKVNNENMDQTKKIPSSTLRFWNKPSEEKIKASQRRTKDNIYGSTEILMKLNQSVDNAKIPSELSLFSEDLNFDSFHEKGKVYNEKYRNFLSHTQHLSRRDRTLSVAYDCGNINPITINKIRNCQSSGNVNTLVKNVSIVSPYNDDVCRAWFQYEFSRNQLSETITPPKRNFIQNKSRKMNKFSVSPPSYEKMMASNVRNKSKGVHRNVVSAHQLKSNSRGKTYSTDFANLYLPKPPPRSESLIRSFELICKNLQTSITRPRGDCFKIFKNQNDYEAWLKNLPYHNPEEISTLLRLRSKVARRHCVSELLNVNISDLNFDKKRRHSWPLLKRTYFPSENRSTKRCSSLSRVKIKNSPTEKLKVNVDSPSLCNYSRLYCLRSSLGTTGNLSVKAKPSYHPDSSMLSKHLPYFRSSNFTIQNRRSSKHNQRQENITNSRMAVSCYETQNNSLI